MGCVHRPLRRILPYSDTSDRQEVAPLRWNGDIFQFRALPFGLSLAPWVFTRIVRELCSSHLRRRGCTPESLSRRLARLSKLQAIVREPHTDAPRRDSPSGLSRKYRKSELSSSQSFTYLGMDFDTVSSNVRLSLPRALKLQTLLSCLLKKKVASAKTLASLLGMLESLAPLLPLGRLHKREFQHQFRVRWGQSAEHWERWGGGETRSRVLSRMAEIPLLWCQDNNFCLTMHYIAGKINMVVHGCSNGLLSGHL